MTVFQGRNVTKTRRKEQKIKVIYESMKKAPNYKKGKLRDTKRQMNSQVPLPKGAVWALQTK